METYYIKSLSQLCFMLQQTNNIFRPAAALYIFQPPQQMLSIFSNFINSQMSRSIHSQLANTMYYKFKLPV